MLLVQRLHIGLFQSPVYGKDGYHYSDDHVVPHRYGDVSVDTHKAQEVYRQWLDMTRPQTERADSLRRPLWMIRPYRPSAHTFRRSH